MPITNYQVGKQYPSFMNHLGCEKHKLVAVANESSFDVFYFTPRLGSSLTLQWNLSPINYGLFCIDNAPIFLLNFLLAEEGKLRMHLSSSWIENLHEWLEKDDQVINLFLVESSNKKIHAIRMESYCHDYGRGVYENATSVMQEYSIEEMYERALILHEAKEIN